MLSKRLFLGHGPLVAYVSLFIALGGSGYAATRIASIARSAPVKVRCSATHAGKRVSCKVVKGSGVGPRGPQGPPGKNGNTGAAGATTYTQPPAFAFFEQTPGTTSTSVNVGALNDNDEWQNFALFTAFNQDIPTSAPGEPILRTWLESPSELDGSPAHLQSVQFCYGGQSSTSPVANAQLTHATVVEYVEPNGAVPPNTAQPPAYNTVALYDTALTNTVPAGVNGAGGCETVAPPSPVAIQADGELALDLTYTFTAPQSDQSGIQVTLGRVTTTYSP
jgi:hypothetical protein